MPIEYNENGITIQTLSEILDERENNLQTFLGADFTISGDNAIANIQLSDADREYDLQELLLYIAMQLDPDQAEGIWLDFICALNNITRYRPEKTTIPITVTGTIGASKTAQEITIVDETTNEYYTNNDAFTIEGDGNTDVTFICTSFGDISASPSSTYTLKTPSLGIASVAYNPSGTKVVGRYAETDIELRARRIQTIELTASSTLESIKANVSQVSGVTYLNVYENDTMSTVDTIPAKAFEVVVQGGTDADIAAAILEKKPAGIQAYGTDTVTIVDDDGNNFTIGLTRPTATPVEFRISIKVSSLQTGDWETTVKQALVDKFEELYNVGEDIYVYNLYCVLNNYEAILNVTNFQVEKEIDSANWADTLVIAKREVGTLSIENITITQST